MIKMYKGTAEQLLLLSLYHREYTGHSAEQVVDRLRNFALPGAEGVVFSAAKKTLKLLPPDSRGAWPTSVIDTLTKGLIEDDSARGDVDLIDQMVRAMQLPHGRNILSGESMRRLKSAILLPSELAGLSARLATREMSCSQCGFPFHDRESVTVMRLGDGTQTLTCHRCHPPQVVPCASCEETAALSSKAQNAMSRMQCPSCSEKKASALAKSPPPEEEAAPTPTFRSALGRSTGALSGNPGGVSAPSPQQVGTIERFIDANTVAITGLNENENITNRALFAVRVLQRGVDRGAIPSTIRASIGDHLFVDLQGRVTEE